MRRLQSSLDSLEVGLRAKMRDLPGVNIEDWVKRISVAVANLMEKLNGAQLRGGKAFNHEYLCQVRAHNIDVERLFGLVKSAKQRAPASQLRRLEDTTRVQQAVHIRLATPASVNGSPPDNAPGNVALPAGVALVSSSGGDGGGDGDDDEGPSRDGRKRGLNADSKTRLAKKQKWQSQSEVADVVLPTLMSPETTQQVKLETAAGLEHTAHVAREKSLSQNKTREKRQEKAVKKRADRDKCSAIDAKLPQELEKLKKESKSDLKAAIRLHRKFYKTPTKKVGDLSEEELAVELHRLRGLVPKEKPVSRTVSKRQAASASRAAAPRRAAATASSSSRAARGKRESALFSANKPT
jgi:hypothetical protein